MSSKGKSKKSRKQLPAWEIRDRNDRYRVIASAVAKRHADGGWTFRDRKGIVVGYGPGELLHVNRFEPVPVEVVGHFEPASDTPLPGADDAYDAELGGVRV